MTDVSIRPGMTDTDLKTLERAAIAAGRGTTQDAPLRVVVEPGTHDLMLNQFKLTASFRDVSSEGAVFQGTGAPKNNRSLWLATDATHVVWHGGEVAGADLASVTSRLGTSVQTIHGVTFRDYDSSNDGIGSSNFEGDTLKASARMGLPTKAAPWITHLRSCNFHDWTGRVNTHPIYIHGRYGELHVDACEFAGGFESSALKTTRNVITVRDSRFFGETRQLRGEAPTGERSFSKFIDVPSCSELVVSGCQFFGGYHGSRFGGVSHMIALRNRRDLWGADDIPPADVHWEGGGSVSPIKLKFVDSNVRSGSSRGVYATLGDLVLAISPASVYARTGLAGDLDSWDVTILAGEVPASGRYDLTIRADDGVTRPACKPVRLTVYRDDQYLLVSSFYDATPSKLGLQVNADYWESLGDLADPQNPHSLKAWISDCDFERLQNPDIDPQYRGECHAIRLFGTHPLTAVKQFSINNYLHPVMPTWQDRSTAFVYGNTYAGWRENERYLDISPEGEYRAIDKLWGHNRPAPLVPVPAPRIVQVQPEVATYSRRPGWFRT